MPWCPIIRFTSKIKYEYLPSRHDTALAKINPLFARVHLCTSTDKSWWTLPAARAHVDTSKVAWRSVYTRADQAIYIAPRIAVSISDVNRLFSIFRLRFWKSPNEGFALSVWHRRPDKKESCHYYVESFVDRYNLRYLENKFRMYKRTTSNFPSTPTLNNIDSHNNTVWRAKNQRVDRCGHSEAPDIYKSESRADLRGHGFNNAIRALPHNMYTRQAPSLSLSCNACAYTRRAFESRCGSHVNRARASKLGATFIRPEALNYSREDFLIVSSRGEVWIDRGRS